MANKTSITVSTHVARDFLQNAAYFSSLQKVVWEYVSNSIDNTKDNLSANVAVDIMGSLIRIADDSSGMSRQDLQSFFQMHGENRQRQKGKRVRGRFGTGKCAAFGIANHLRIDSTKNGKRNIVELFRKDIEEARNGEPFPVQDNMVDEVTQQLDGTIVEIRDLNIKQPDIEATILYVERHLGRYRQRAHVTINGQECKFKEPQSIDQFAFRSPPNVAIHIGEVNLVIKVSPIPLEPESNGIDILSHGIWHETTLAGLQNREMIQYLFGEVDVPNLEDKEWPIPPFDNTRNNTLNAQSPVVAVLYGWISKHLDEVRLKLVARERERRKSEEAQKLKKEAEKIAEILNDDFIKLQMEFEFAKQIASRRGKVKSNEIEGANVEALPGDGDEPTAWQEAGKRFGKEAGLLNPITHGDTPKRGSNLIPGDQLGSQKSVSDGVNKRRKGLFAIDYRNETAENHRSRYERETRTIVINLDHPQIASAFTAGEKNTESRGFREISYEVAVVEYAQAIPFEKIDQEGDQYQASEALFDVRDTINRLTRRFTELLQTYR